MGIFTIIFIFISNYFVLKTIIVLTFSQNVNLSQNNSSMQNPSTLKQAFPRYQWQFGYGRRPLNS